jgi:hypothetical protein
MSRKEKRLSDRKPKTKPPRRSPKKGGRRGRNKKEVSIEMDRVEDEALATTDTSAAAKDSGNAFQVAFGLVWRLTAKPKSPRALLAIIAAILSVVLSTVMSGDDSQLLASPSASAAAR